MKLNKDARIDYLITYISKHPNQSGSKIYERFKGTKYGMRKKEFYKVYRNTKGLKKPSKEKRMRSVPKKYRVSVAKRERERKKVEEEKPELKKEYSPFFKSIEYMVFNKMRRKPDNLRDMEYNLYRYGFNKGKYPSGKQVSLAWNYLKSKGLTER